MKHYNLVSNKLIKDVRANYLCAGNATVICHASLLVFLVIRSDEGLTLETSAFQFLYAGQFTLSTLLINQIFVYFSY